MKIEILETKNYRIFDFYEVNRNVVENSDKFKKLVRSMKAHGFLPAYPLHCIKNGKGMLKIKAGHHRFVAAQKLGLPVKYVVSDDQASIYELEVGPGQWNTRDYFDSYCKKGVADYLVVKQFMEKTGIGLTNSLSMFWGHSAGTGNYMNHGHLQSGRYRIKTPDHANTVGDIVMHLKNLGVECATSGHFVMALSRMLFLKEFNPRRYKDKAKTHKHLIEKQRNVQAYLQNIEDVYNRNAPKKHQINIAFLAQKETDSRNVARVK